MWCVPDQARADRLYRNSDCGHSAACGAGRRHPSAVDRGIITATYIGAFVAFLTLLNLRTPSKWGNAVLGRRVFPVLSAGQDSDVWKLAGVNAVLVFCFAFFYQVLAATLVGPFLAGILVFGGLVGAGIFYNRARKVIVKP